MNRFKINFALVLFLFFYSNISAQSIENQMTLDINSAEEKVQLFGEGVISTKLQERDFALSPDGKEIIFTLQNHKQSARVLVSLKKQNETWLEPKILPFSGKYADIEPFFSPEGGKLFFASNRPMDNDSTRKDYNIWVAEKNEGLWKTPIPLPKIINSEKDEFYPSVGKSGNLYFTATYKGGIGSEDIWVSEFSNGIYLQPTPLDTNINSKTYEFNAYVSPDEDLIIYSSYGRTDGLGGGDLYISRKNEKGKWSKSSNLGKAVNSKYLDYCPFVDLKNNTLYFTSNREPNLPENFKDLSEFKAFSNQILNGFGNIYRIRLAD